MMNTEALRSHVEKLLTAPPLRRIAQTRIGEATVKLARFLAENPLTLAERLRRAEQDLEATERYMKMHNDPNQWPSFEAMSEVIDDPLRPPLDRLQLDESRLTPRQLFWCRNGYLILENFIPHDRIDAYIAARKKWADPGGYYCPTPYMHVPEILELSLYPPLVEVMRELFGAEMVLHLNLTGWVSTERDWHQDDYLNPPVVNGWYLASWMALDDIHPDSGPFQFVPGSHGWPILRQEKILSFLPPLYARALGQRDGYGSWAKWSEDFVAKAIQRKIEDSGLEVKSFAAKKGDVLLWHGCLAHRGSVPRVRGTPRLTLISHYSEISHRPDFIKAGRILTHRDGGKYADFGLPLY
jgi:hypothetical protein